MRIVKSVLLLFLLTVAALGIVRFFFLDQLTALALQKTGADDVSVHLSRVGLAKVQIDTLNATLKLPSGESLPVKLKNISLQYTLRQLLLTGKCNRIAIKTMEIRRTALKQNPVSPLSLPEHITLLRNDLRARLPLEELHIDRLLLSGDLPPQLTGRKIQLNAAIRDTAISAEISLQLTDDTSIAVNLNSIDAFHGTAEFNGHKGQEKIVQGSLRLSPDNVAGKIDLLLQPVRGLLHRHADIPQLPAVEGHLNGNFSLPLPVRDTTKIHAEFTLLDQKDHQLHLTVESNPNASNLSLIFSGQEKDQVFISTGLNINNLRIRGAYELDFDPLASFLQPYLRQPLPEISGRLQGELDIPLPGNRDRSFAVTARAANLDMVNYSSSAAEIKLTGEMKKNDLFLDRNSTFHGKRLVFGKTSIRELSFSPAGNFSQTENGFFLTFTEQQAIRIKELKTGTLDIDDIYVQPQKPLRISIHDTFWSVNADKLLVRPLVITEGSRKYSTGSLTCRLTRLDNSGPSIEISSQIKTPSVVLQDRQLKLPLKNVAGTIHFSNNLLNGKFQLSPAAIKGRARASFTHDFAAGSGSFTLRTDRRIDLDQENISLAKLFTPWHFPFDLDSGKVSFTSGGSWKPHKNLQLSAFVALTGGSGFFKQFLFKGLNFRQDLAVLPRLYSKTKGSFSLQHLIGGIDLYTSHANLNFLPAKNGTLPLVRISDFSASLLDGTITSPDILYDLNRPDSEFIVNINKVNLTKLIDLIQMESLHVTGRISGTIPVTIKGKDISVVNGELHSKPPGGDIRYTPKNMHQSGLTGYALKAVEDFQYHSLKATAMYVPSGHLDLDISLQGKSPELDANRPVNLNIHAEQNLPALLQSLRFSRGLTEKLDKRVKQHYK